MTHPLDGARLKIVRAQIHLESINAAVVKYRSLKPYAVGIQKDPDEWYGRADVTHHPDPMIRAIIGDCLHNLSSALDYTMWEVVGTHAGRVLDPRSDKLYFPLRPDPASFDETILGLRRKYKLTDAVIDTLERVQPYQTGYESLSFFRELCNADKHRLPLVVIGEIEGLSTIVWKIPRTAELDPTFPGNSFEQDAKMETQATVCITWQDPFMPPEPVERTLDDFVKCVADIVPRFDKFVI